MAEKNVVAEFLEQFTPSVVKQDESRTPYLIEHTGESKQAIPLESDRGEQMLRKFAKRVELRLVGKSVKEAFEEVKAIAWEHEQPLIKPQIRYGMAPSSDAVTIDLSNGQIVQLSAQGVDVLDSMPASNEELYFQRSSFQLPMVTPKLPCVDMKSALKKLRDFINTDQDTFLLLVAYMTYLMAHPKLKGVPYPILMIQGEKGTGKSFFCNNVLRGLLDPSAVSAMAFPKQSDFVLTINGMSLVVIDNLRSLTKRQSDLLCTVATKGTMTKRTLYKTAEVTMFELHSPLVLNGIHDFVKESDLASRCLRVNLEPMKKGNRRPEQELKADLEASMPEIFGALLTLASQALAILPDVEVIHEARMMDYAKWIGALERVWKLPEGKLQKVYEKNVESLMASGMVDDSLTIALTSMVKKLGGKAWKGKPSQLLSKLQEHEDSQYLPKGAAALSAKIKGQESSLNANGIYFKFGRAAERYIMVSDKPLI
ncbi:ATP-binding protein [Vibrio crassostreae]|uniref:ATP-binding protein n=1 Tax=Vibrio crassostreae TaxID=246167 RepID=UPI001B308C91|nr:ATP-binding protein [Vibrio crassostreae]CAK1734528.1 ATP-binding protein [Vibrio crassostreae]CAK1743331.1 ATP-binding protein [Vibrio crassostreae]CAK1763360.1 ATP-binding protein [Vibrio crassostreae]CAK1768648.1 ATP-binding protein [Vibrio crassostreae]CAK1770150.1 ATP-binding protein [Vibrio crassostreae]